jgi:GAF domain-containing protein
VLTFGSHDERAYTQEDIEFMERVGGLVAVAVENALSLDTIREQRAALESERDRLGLLLDVAAFGLGLGGSVRLGSFELHDQRALGDLVAYGDLDRRDLARGRRRHFHRRLVGLEDDERRLLLHLVADGDEDLDDRDGVEIADVRDLDFEAQSRTLRRSDSWLTKCAVKRAASAPSITRWS